MQPAAEPSAPAELHPRRVLASCATLERARWMTCWRRASRRARPRPDASARCFPQLLELTGAEGVAITTRDEELVEQTWRTGDFGDRFPGTLLAGPVRACARMASDTLVTQALDVVGTPVGAFGLLFPGDHTGAAATLRGSRVLETVAEQLDTVLCLRAHRVGEAPADPPVQPAPGQPVFEAGMDQAVLALAQRVRLPGFLLLYRDAVRAAAAALPHLPPRPPGVRERRAARSRRWSRPIRAARPAADRARGRPRCGRCCGEPRRSRGGAHLRRRPPASRWARSWSGADEGFSAYTMDLVRVLASTLSASG